MPSFDIISEVDSVEVRNAAENANRELDTRFDFRNVEAKFEFKNDIVKLSAENDYQLGQMMTMLRGQLAKRGVDANAVDLKKAEQTGKMHTQEASFKQGIETDVAKKVVKLIKEAKLKVQASIQGDKVRVTGKKRDDLQQAMSAIRQSELEQPFQFNNFKD
ncbi:MULTISPECIES: YajQ family cyclic di-GMP-binding protein [Vibrio]|uniref:Nucleotide-binding protein GFB47_06065 n=1 Tax=Vibrio algicola TaxID=2662262 RepID=A0A5Q0TFS6_9VIBR|nr:MULTISPECIES: YajQ family cyclic di-GMP-binding protein [Vibrio]MBD1575638.1 YajQ family cyclic di-GMP-binding protein [Vibrio sp. S11_S32]